MRDTGLAGLSQDAAGWHQKMGKAFGYNPASPSPEKAASEAFRQELLKAVQTGDFSQLGLPIEAVPGEQMGGRPAAFLGGDTATGADDRIVVNQDLLQKAAHDEGARSQLNAGIAEEFMHGLERKIHKGKSGDMQLNDSGEIAFMEFGQGRSFDEGKFARELAPQPYHNFEELMIASAMDDHGFVNINGEQVAAEFKDFSPNSSPIDEVANDNKNHSVRYRVNRKDNEYINDAFKTPEDFKKIWNHHENDQDLNGWLGTGTGDMQGSRGNTKGVTKYVGWVLEQADTGKAPKAAEEKRKLLGEDGVLGDNAWLNSRNNDEIDGSGKDKTVGIDAGLLKHVPADQLVALKGTRAGTSNVQKAIGQQIAEDPQAYADLQAYFGQGTNGADFLNKFTDDEIRTMDPNLLAAIPLEQINAAEGTRGAAALQKIFDPKIGGNGEYKNGGKWENHEGELLSPGSQLLSNTAQTSIADELANNPDYSNLAAQAEQANVALENKPTKHDAMGQQVASELFGEKGTELTHMSNKEQQEYMDTWIASNADNPEELAASLSFPAKTLAKAKAENGGKLPANAGPLVKLLDKINTEEAKLSKLSPEELENKGRGLKTGVVEVGLVLAVSAALAGIAVQNEMVNDADSGGISETSVSVAGSSSQTQQPPTGTHAIVGTAYNSVPDNATNLNDPFLDLGAGNFSYDQYGNLYDLQNSNEPDGQFVVVDGEIAIVEQVGTNNYAISYHGENQPIPNLTYVPGHGVSPTNNIGVPTMAPVNQPLEGFAQPETVPQLPSVPNLLGPASDALDTNFMGMFDSVLAQPGGPTYYDEFGNLYDQQGELSDRFAFFNGHVYQINHDEQTVTGPDDNGNTHHPLPGYAYHDGYGVVPVDENGNLSYQPVNKPRPTEKKGNSVAGDLGGEESGPLDPEGDKGYLSDPN